MSRAHQRSAAAGRGRQRGLMLVGLLILMFLTGVLAMTGLDVWATTRQREREAELLFVGDQYRQAIRRYYFAAGNGQTPELPAKLEELLDDNRFPVPAHHLRRLYADPITGSTEWGLVMRGDRIVGVHSLSEATPLKQAGFDRVNASFEARTAYKDWVFLFIPPATRRR
jgi:type II secretory pathway pseudopilin PulG